MKEYEKQILELCKEYNNIFIYISLDDELDTKSVIKRLLSMNKKVIIPKCVGERELITCRLHTLESLSEGKYSILEPDKHELFPVNDIDIFFVPGTLFDKQCNRKGRGKGYFDRFLKDIKGKKKIIGLCRKDQYVDKIKPNDWDVSVDQVITG